MEDPQAELIAEQIRHALDMLRTEISALRKDIAHVTELSNHRLVSLEKCQEDMESRLRAATDGVTQFKVWSGLSNGFSSLLSIAAFIRTLGLGG